MQDLQGVFTTSVGYRIEEKSFLTIKGKLLLFTAFTAFLKSRDLFFPF